MRLFVSICLLFLTALLDATPLRTSDVNPRGLATVLGIPVDADLLLETQKRWLRPIGQDRWEVAELSTQTREIVIEWAKEQGMFAPWYPILQKYDKAVILGSSTISMKERLNYLAMLWEQGIRFKEVVWLTGDRPLDPQIDDLARRCDTESESAHILWQESLLPQGLRNLPVSFLSTPMQNKDGLLRRPNTADTLYSYLELNPKPCQLLFISDQPFCGYQLAVIEGILPPSFSYDLAGPGRDPSSHPQAAAITLDNIARWLYEQNQIRS